MGFPLIVSVLELKEGVSPEGRPLTVPMEVTALVVCVIGVRAVLIHKLGDEEAADTEAKPVTVMVPVAFIEPHPPVRGMV